MENHTNQETSKKTGCISDSQETLYQNDTNSSTKAHAASRELNEPFPDDTNSSAKESGTSNEETICNPTEQTKANESQQQGKSNQSNASIQNATAPGVCTAVATGAGSLAGAAAGVVAGTMINEQTAAAADSNEEEQQDITSSHSSIVDDSMQIATTPNDDMPFSEAFAAARAEVGPGGVFEWHGHLYGTYYASEWDAMTQDEKNEYNSHFSWHSTSSANNSAQDNASEEPETAEDSEEAEVQVLSVETVATEYGTMDVATLDVDGDEVYLVDLDQDGQADVGVMDFNNDGQLTQEEFVDIRDAGVMIPNAPNSNQDILLASGNAPDYTNDADVDEYYA